MKRLLIICIYVVFNVAVPFLLLARQEPRFTNLNLSNGLRSGDVMCFQQDKYGFIWIGTKYGLNVYDGSDFNIFGFGNRAPFNSDISALQLGQKENMWIGTAGEGLYCYNHTDRSLEHLPLYNDFDSVSSVTCLSFFFDHLWVGTDRGLFRIRKGQAPEVFDTGTGTAGILEMAIHDGKLVISVQGHGLFLVHPTELVQRLEFPSGQVNALLSLDENRLLLGTQYSGLYCISTEESIPVLQCHNDVFPETPPVIKEIIRDQMGNIWVGTDGEGLFSFTSLEEGGEVKNYRFDSGRTNSIASNAIFSLFEDQGGRLWIGTIWKGLSILDLNAPNSGLIYSDLSGDDAYPVLSVYNQGDELWLGTDGKGISIIDNKTRELSAYNTATRPALSGNYVQHIFCDSRGLYWIGTFSSGLNRLDRSAGRITSFISSMEDSSSLSYNDVRMVLEDDNSDLWIATWGGGLNFYDRERNSFRSYFMGVDFDDPQLTSDITSICWSGDRKGLWVGTFGNGLFYFDTRTLLFTQIRKEGLERLKILSLRLDDSAYLWMGTWGDGLVVYSSYEETGAFREALSPLGSSRITSVEEDRQGRIWLSSKDGIYKFDPSDSSLLRVRATDLLSNKEFHIAASNRDREGNLYFGGLEGVLKIAPGLTEVMEDMSPPIITNTYLFNENLSSYSPREKNGSPELKLDYNQNFITFSFSSPKYPVSDVSYSYRLENFNDVWVSTRGNRATFPSLPPGKYTFSVRSSHHNLEWSEPTRLSLHVAQPYWKAWYAYVVYVSLFVLLLYLFQKYTRDFESVKSNLQLETFRREKEEEVSAIKQRFFTNISHEIRTPVTLMLGATNKLVEDGSVSRGKQKEITVLRNSSRHLLNLINELLDFRRLESGGIRLRVAEGDFQKFVQEIYLSFHSQAYDGTVDYRFVSREETMKLWFDRDQMEKVLYNLISNAFKYTPPGGVISVEVDQDDQYAYLKVADSGLGVKEEKLKEIFRRFYQSDNASHIREKGFGLGLSVTRDIVKMHGGEIYARNNEGPGLTISAKLPLGSNHFPEGQQINDFHSSEHLENYVSDKLTISTSEEEYDLSDEQILIVEDNDDLREYLQGLFAGKMKVLTAANGEEGLHLAGKHIPDIVVSDVMMPVMDGVSMTKSLKTGVATSHIPVILLTARTTLIYKKEGFDMGADDYITKPFNEVLLKSRVMNILKNRKQFREKLMSDFLRRPREELNISTPDQKFLADLTGVIEKNIEENEISAALISSELGMSHSVIYKKVKGLTGMSLIEFVRDFKLNRAAVLLSKYELSITDVCYRVGFSDRRYFSKLFKSKYGVNPSEYPMTN